MYLSGRIASIAFPCLLCAVCFTMRKNISSANASGYTPGARVHVCNIILDRFPGIQSPFEPNHFTDRLPLSLDTVPTYDVRL